MTAIKPPRFGYLWGLRLISLCNVTGVGFTGQSMFRYYLNVGQTTVAMVLGVVLVCLAGVAVYLSVPTFWR